MMKPIKPLSHEVDERRNKKFEPNYNAFDEQKQQQEKAPLLALSEDQSFLVTELEYEVKKLSAELRHLQSVVDGLEAKSDIWLNPLSAYEKEIFMKNGTRMYGNVLDQDVSTITIETFIGQIVISKEEVLRVENIAGVDEELGFDLETHPFLAGAYNRIIASGEESVQENIMISEYPANPVLVGKIEERRDKLNNARFSGTIKNEGGTRADFVRIRFIFRTDWSGGTKEFTSFVKGSIHTFDNGVTTDASLKPSESAEFELFIPQEFSTHLGYSYKIEWEKYN